MLAVAALAFALALALLLFLRSRAARSVPRIGALPTGARAGFVPKGSASVRFSKKAVAAITAKPLDAIVVGSGIGACRTL